MEKSYENKTGLLAKIKNKLHQTEPRSVFNTIMLPLLLLLVAESIMLVGVIYVSDVIQQLNCNAEDILSNQVKNRSDYLTTLLYSWSDLDHLADTVNTRAQAMIDSGEIDLDKLDSDSNTASPLILSITDDLVSTLYSKSVSGIYVVFNTQDIGAIPKKRAIPNKTGIYIRDMDPTSPPSGRYEDLLLARAPIQVTQSLTIATDSCWRPQFTFSDIDTPENFCYFTKPFIAAYEAESIRDPSDYGYWGCAVTPLLDSDLSAVTYSIPLVLDDGTVYGVLGIDILDSYLKSLIPGSELYDNNVGAYFLSVQRANVNSLRIVLPFVWNGSAFDNASDVSFKFSPSNSGYTFTVKNGTSYYAATVPINLYSNNAPFEDEHWMIIGAVPTTSLYDFSDRVIVYLLLDLVLMIFVGALGSFIISRKLSAPIRRLSNDVEKAKSTGGIPHLEDTGIAELDQFADAFTSLSRDVVSASTRFLQIIKLASVDLSGFELRNYDNSVYVTDNFFEMMGLCGVMQENLTADRFKELIAGLKIDKNIRDTDGGVLYNVLDQSGKIKYIRIKVTNLDSGQVGVAEDVTLAIADRLRVEHERDYDMLTGLIGRRAFCEKLEELFGSGEVGHAAVMMFDLDNLKKVNDKYGHDYGDKYIFESGRNFRINAPENAFCSRVSGDEFFLVIYGYDTREGLQQAIDRFMHSAVGNSFIMPNGERISLDFSGGYAVYPDDSDDFHQLMKYADFAMYQIKHGTKGCIGKFSKETYEKENLMLKAHEEFVELVRDEKVYFHFQPIVDASCGEIRAYEALMRSDMPTLRSPAVILDIARQEHRLQDIEDLTWVKAPECYQEMVRKYNIRDDILLFINSIGNQIMSRRAQERLVTNFSDVLRVVVTEITETDNVDKNIIAIKRSSREGLGMFALDDYGSGYNSEVSLLELSPKFIKVDISIIRDIDSDPDKQRIVSNIVNYARERSMLIIAEGVETVPELKKLLEIGVDLLQGYLLARPSAEPTPISQEALDVIKEFNSNKK